MSTESHDEPLRDSSKHEEFLLLFSQERRRIYAVVFTLVPIAADADDIFQHVSLVLWRKFNDYDATQSFYRWACGIAHYTVQNYRRQKRRSRVYFTDSLLDSLATERIEHVEQDSGRFEALRNCVSLLKEKDRLLIRQVYEAGTSVKESAAKMGLSAGSTYNRLSLIRKRLLECVNRKLSLSHRGGEQCR